ncbi:hypothetical protein SAY87_014623 [Trapa incisa]|uniref:TF-B3 domain-containing protein n=1 Tax=Trapa incisa TaxID=236973 RepID=A0AAN7GWF9_9MYRT|nr:hypothetical protein SAY87_014623 [Trapa incisa]
MVAVQQDDEIQPLSGKKPFFHTMVCPSQIKPKYTMFLPVKIYSILPSEDVPAVLMCRGKEWGMVYYGNGLKRKRFNVQWRHFADDNALKVGDACVFELMVCTKEVLKFRVQILRGDIPLILQYRVPGANSDHPLVIE